MKLMPSWHALASNRAMADATSDIIVIGAGMAGLVCARALAEAGLNVMVLEASSRVGGRILTLRDDEEILELGAEFIHGQPPELWSLIEEAGLETYELDGTDLCFEGGDLQECDNDQEKDQNSILDKLEGWDEADLTFAQYLDRKNVTDEQRGRAIGYVEGFNAADHRVISVTALGMQQAAEDTVEGDRLWRVKDGYDRVPQFVARKIREAGGTFCFDTLVERVEWRPGSVKIEANASGRPATYNAHQVVIALPLGVLQQKSVAFLPVPAPLFEANRLRMGHVRRFTLIFRERFWERMEPSPLNALSFLFSFQSMPPVWWTPHPAASNSLTGWVGGPRSEALGLISPDKLAHAAFTELANIFSMRRDELSKKLIRCVTHDWQRDALSFGAYSYVPAGALDACEKMTRPVDETLYFAGEHTDTTGHWGTVHAAIRSGLRAAQQILVGRGS